MRKIFLLAVMAICTITASAQVEKGLRSGMTLTGSISNYSGIDGASNSLGFGGGYIVEYNLNKNLYIGSGLQFGLRGAKMKSFEYMGQKVALNKESDVRSYNIILPVNIGGRVSVADNTHIFAQAGPYVSYAAKTGGIEVALLGGRKDNVKCEAFDYGINAKAGVEFNNIQIYGGYELGMAEVWKKDGKNRSIVFGAAYMF